MKRLSGLLLLAIAAVALQGPLPIPPCEGKECHDDYTDENHAGMPAFCQNYDTPAWKQNCKCERDCDQRFATGCVRHCMKAGCNCNHGCDSK
jgi:hypothetical protein